MKLIIGLGNPEDKYKNTRHNVGYMAIDEIIRVHNFPQLKIHGLSFMTQKENIMLVKPDICINDSGIVVKSYKNNYDFKEIIVIHDDIDLDKGIIKMVYNRGHGGHNGVKSIHKAIGSEYKRFKIGIGKEKPVLDYVLGNFTSDEKANYLDKTLTELAEIIL